MRDFKHEPVFIVGCSRTGSTMLRGIINDFTLINITTELHIRSPRWLHKDFVANIKGKLGTIDSPEKIEALIDLFYSKTLFGMFWNRIALYSLDRKILYSEIEMSDRSTASIVKALLKVHAYSLEKERWGAKFPVHIQYTPELRKWFPKCKIIHTIRDPRAIFSSQYYKNVKNKQFPYLKKYALGLLHFFHINHQFYWASRIHQSLKNDPGYFLCKYEDLITNPEKSIRTLCDFLGVDFSSKMLRPRVVTAMSYGKVANPKDEYGFKTTSLKAWQNKLPPIVTQTIKVIHSRALSSIGYNQL